MVSVSEGEWFERDVLYKNSAITGGWRKVVEPLNHALGGYSRGKKDVYIGIASGADEIEALESRHDSDKVDWAIDRMVCIFRSGSQEACKKLEKKLIDDAIKRYGKKREGGKLLNRAPGGGGADSEGPKYFVYVAIAEYGQSS